jgi:hypothetical protein
MENGKLKIERWGFRQLLTSLAEWCENVGTHRMRPLAYVCLFTNSGGEVGIFTVLTGFQ